MVRARRADKWKQLVVRVLMLSYPCILYNGSVYVLLICCKPHLRHGKGTPGRAVTRFPRAARCVGPGPPGRSAASHFGPRSPARLHVHTRQPARPSLGGSDRMWRLLGRPPAPGVHALARGCARSGQGLPRLPVPIAMMGKGRRICARSMTVQWGIQKAHYKLEPTASEPHPPSILLAHTRIATRVRRCM